MKKGTLCLSFDVEGKWGRTPGFSGVERETEYVKKLLSIISSRKMRATWAVVGKLFEEDKPLIRLLQASGHEIASHSYSHKDYYRITKEEAEEECKKNTLYSSSFVFPYNHIGYLDVLSAHGFRTFRTGGIYFPSKRKLGKFLPKGARAFIAKRMLDWTVWKGGVLHLWSHPIDFIDDSGQLFGEFIDILDYAYSMKKQGNLEIKTMDQV